MEEKGKLSLERMTALAAFAGWAALPCDDGCIVFSSQYFRAKVDPECAAEDLEYWAEAVSGMKEEAEREYGREGRKYELMLETEDALRALMRVFRRDAEMDDAERKAVSALEQCGFDAAIVRDKLRIKYCGEEFFAEFEMDLPENAEDKTEFIKNGIRRLADEQKTAKDEDAAEICRRLRTAERII